MRKALTIFLCVYAFILVSLIPSKGLWMDEIIDLNGVRSAYEMNDVLAFVPGNAGGVPRVFVHVLPSPPMRRRATEH